MSKHTASGKEPARPPPVGSHTAVVACDAELNPLYNPREIDKTLKTTPSATPRTGRSAAATARTEGEQREMSSVSDGSSMYTDISSSWSTLTQQKKRFFKEGTCLSWIDDLQAPQWYRKMRPRRRQYLYCFISEMIIAAALCGQYGTFRQGVRQIDLHEVAHQVELMTMTWARKLEEARLLVLSWSQDEELLSYLKGTGSSARAVEDLMSFDATYLKLEYAVLVDINATVLVDINDRNRTGTFDPHGIVTRVLEMEKPVQYTTAKLLSWDQFFADKAPIYRELYSTFVDYDLTHPFDTHETSLCRYMVMPVFTHHNGTGPLLGAIVIGGVANGKNPITYLTASSFGDGFAALYTETGRGTYIRSSASTVVKGKTVDITDKIHTFSIYDMLTPALQQKLLKPAAKLAGNVLAYIEGDMAWAARSAPPDSYDEVEDPSAPAQAVMVRGKFLQEDPMFTLLLKSTLVPLIFLLGANIVSTYLSNKSFIAPLERLCKALKKKVEVDLTAVGSLDLYATFLCRLVTTLVITLACSLVIAVHAADRMNELLSEVAKSNLGAAEVSYNILVDQMSQGLRHYANTATFRDYLQDTSDMALRNKTEAILKRERSNSKLEFLVLLSRDYVPIASVNPRFSAVTHFDPAGIVTKQVECKQHLARFKMTGMMDYATFNHIHPPTYQKHLIAGVPDSSLSPYNTHRDPFLRFASCPVYASNNHDKKQADGILLAADLINGKPALCERMLLVVGTGYVAYYASDGKGDFYPLCSVLVELKTKKAHVDLTCPHHVFEASARVGGKAATAKGKIDGKPFILAAMEVPKDRMVTKLYGQMDLKGERKYKAYVVYGIDEAATTEVEMQQLTWSIAGALLEIMMMLFVNYMAYKPFYKLVLVLEERGVADPSRRPTVRKVIQVYIIDYTRACIADLRSRPLSESFHKYVIVRGRKKLRRLRRWICGSTRRRSSASRHTGSTSRNSTGMSQTSTYRKKAQLHTVQEN